MTLPLVLMCNKDQITHVQSFHSVDISDLIRSIQ